MTDRTVGKRAVASSRRPTSRTGRAAPRPHRSRWLIVAGVVVGALVVAGLYVIYHTANRTDTGSQSGSGFRYSVGQPGPGAPAPSFRLASIAGGSLDLASLRGKT